MKINVNLKKSSPIRFRRNVAQHNKGHLKSPEIKRHLLLGREVMTNLYSILKSRDITLLKKSPSSQGYGFSCGHVCMQ